MNIVNTIRIINITNITRITKFNITTTIIVIVTTISIILYYYYYYYYDNIYMILGFTAVGLRYMELLGSQRDAAAWMQGILL